MINFILYGVAVVAVFCVWALMVPVFVGAVVFAFLWDLMRIVDDRLNGILERLGEAS